MNVNKACAAYADENKRLNAVVFDLVMTEDYTGDFAWTSDKWTDGVPVTKMFDRNEPITLELDAGTRLRGIAYVGNATGSNIIDFVLNGVWYSDVGGYIEQALPIFQWPWSKDGQRD